MKRALFALVIGGLLGLSVVASYGQGALPGSEVETVVLKFSEKIRPHFDKPSLWDDFIGAYADNLSSDSPQSFVGFLDNYMSEPQNEKFFFDYSSSFRDLIKAEGLTDKLDQLLKENDGNSEKALEEIMDLLEEKRKGRPMNRQLKAKTSQAWKNC